MNNSYIKNVSCENNDELSKLYFNDNKNYLIYPCFKNCSNEKDENDTDCLNFKRELENKEENKGENDEESKRGNIENKASDEENKKKVIIMIIIIIAIIITLLIVFIIIFRKYHKNNDFERKWKKGKEDEELMKDILSDLLPN